MARAWFTSWDAFSSSVMRATRSLTRLSVGSEVSRYGRVFEDFVVCATAWNATANRVTIRKIEGIKTRHSRMRTAPCGNSSCSCQAWRRAEYSTVDSSRDECWDGLFSAYINVFVLLSIG